MDTYKIQLQPDYDALSYTRGTDPDSDWMNIEINDHKYPVTLNVYDALQQFRHNQYNNMTKWKLWIDTFCIHQADNAEKSSQIMLMKDIYAGARNVLIWLGKPDSHTQLTFDTLERFSADGGTPDGSATYQDIDILGTLNEWRAAIELFIQRPYFDRVWIFQEAVVAKQAMVFCGRFFTTFDKLYAACKRMTGSGFLPYTISTIGKLTYLGDWRRYYQKLDGYHREDAFDVNIFVDSRDKSTSDLRDKVNALRGLLNTTISKGIVVD